MKPKYARELRGKDKGLMSRMYSTEVKYTNGKDAKPLVRRTNDRRHKKSTVVPKSPKETKIKI